METNKKQLFTALLSGVVIVILFVGGCKKEISSSDSENIKKPDLQMSSDGGTGKDKVLRQSPGLKVEMKSKSSNRVYPTLQGVEKLTALLTDLNKKKKAEVITTSSATFSATAYGSWYSCTVDFLDPTGTKDFYIVNENTWVFTYIGSTSEPYATFAINKPSMYGSYRIWIEGGNGNQFSNPLYLGDPYTGVSVSSGVMSFTNVASYDALLARLRTAYDAHQTYIDTYNAWTDDDAVHAQLVSDGFDEFLPFQELEAYFGFSSFRAQLRAQVLYWQTQVNENGDNYPEDAYLPISYEQQTLMNTEGQIYIGGGEYGTITLPLTAGRKRPSSYGPLTCMTETDIYDHPIISTNPNRKLKLNLWLNPRDDHDNLNTEFQGRTRTMNKFLDVWKDVEERQKVKVAGTYYNGCLEENTFDSGWTNTDDKRRYSTRVEQVVGPNRTSKSGEFEVRAHLSKFSSNDYVLVYTH
jgi:hypothetical protein